MATFEALGIRKSYGGTHALKGVDFRVRSGSVHALLGENGAGKSTLVKILTGAQRPDAGEVQLDGRVVHFANTAEAGKHGVAVVSQELSLFPDMDVLSNLYPMRERRRGPLVDRTEMRRLALPVLHSLGLNPDLNAPLADLSLAERQLIEIARALITQPQVLVLDEPTSALEASSSARLLSALKVLRERQVAVVFVSHILQEVMDLCDEVTVLRDGEVVLASAPVKSLGVSGIVSTMLGDRAKLRRVEEDAESRAGVQALAQQVTSTHAGPLTVSGLKVQGGAQDVNLEVRPGEVIGLTGLMGAGHQSVLEAVAGLRRTDAGSVTFPDGRPGPRDLRAGIARGLAYVTGDRKRLGLMLDKSIWENVAAVQSVGLGRTGLWLSVPALRQRAQDYVKSIGIRVGSVDHPVSSLSGGNQQKVVLAKWLETQPGLLLLDDPTRGVDVGAKAEMHGMVRALADGGAPTLVCSTDLEELTGLCDRVLVFYAGHMCAELSGEALNSQTLLEAMNTGRGPSAEVAA
ncbi:sugar ABC transporter ATP-binding protein [Deinococcus alpinitundrae]|uniref:sugar ABC transporter ATP-binding protein n=1 Tax=Deinococcus alpinitundrae TaxID=468913 RepID=UPI00137B61FB|nr:sugar ABC transporter ATP-binding protein [Deinococcus alpinitundrae]